MTLSCRGECTSSCHMELIYKLYAVNLQLTSLSSVLNIFLLYHVKSSQKICRNLCEWFYFSNTVMRKAKKIKIKCWPFLWPQTSFNNSKLACRNLYKTETPDYDIKNGLTWPWTYDLAPEWRKGQSFIISQLCLLGTGTQPLQDASLFQCSRLTHIQTLIHI